MLGRIFEVLFCTTVILFMVLLDIQLSSYLILRNSHRRRVRSYASMCCNETKENVSNKGQVIRKNMENPHKKGELPYFLDSQDSATQLCNDLSYARVSGFEE